MFGNSQMLYANLPRSPYIPLAKEDFESDPPLKGGSRRGNKTGTLTFYKQPLREIL